MMPSERRFLKVARAAKGLRQWVGYLGSRLRAPQKQPAIHQYKIEEILKAFARSKAVFRLRPRA